MSRLVGSLRTALEADGESDAALLNRVRATRDPAAVEAIVRRHGPKVLAACRKVLGPAIEVDDAFQATFLVLLRNPSAIRRKESLGAWLYGVAHRIAHQASKRRIRREQPVKEVAANGPDLSWREACAILHEELNRLPDAMRLPLMLCYLDGLSRDEAAAQLGRMLNSVKKSLERGREVLRKRLTKRGVALTAGLLAAVAEPVSGDVPFDLIRAATVATIRPSTLAVQLARRAIGNGMLWRATMASIAATTVIVGVVLGFSGDQKADPPMKEPPRELAVQKDQPAPAKLVEARLAKREMDPEPIKANEPLPDKFSYQGRAVTLNGKPVKDARVFLYSATRSPKPLVARATTEANGHFSFEVKRSEFDAATFELSATPWSNGHLIASVSGLGLAWTRDLRPGQDAELLFVLDDVPIEGRILNLEGKPVAGAKVRVLWDLHPAGGDLTTWLNGLKPLANPRDLWKGLEGLESIGKQSPYHTLYRFREVGFDPAIPLVTSGDDGQFEVRGIGRDRVALLKIEGAGIENQFVMAVTRKMEPVNTAPFTMEGITGADTTASRDSRTETIHGAKFELFVGPDRSVVGFVTDVDSGKPIAGAIVSHGLNKFGEMDRQLARTTTGSDGKFRLTGLPMRDQTTLRVDAPIGEPYLPIKITIPAGPGLEPIELKPRLKRGIWLTGKILDIDSKLPVRARVEYGAIPDNPNLAGVTGPVYEYYFPQNRADDGTFRIAVLPGRGYFAITVPEPMSKLYERGQGDAIAPDYSIIPAVPSNFTVTGCHALLNLDVPLDAVQVTKNVVLNAGRSAKVEFRGPDGERLNGHVVLADTPGNRAERLDRDGSLLMRPRQFVQVVCPDQKLAGRFQLVGNEKLPVSVSLESWRTATGRILDAGGKPIEGAALVFDTECSLIAGEEPAGFWYKGTPIRTDKDGRFQIEGLVPGAKYSAFVWAKDLPGQELKFGVDWKRGETKDLGDIKTREPNK
jgi:RNA polymerase sigma factor (sigma-70 family)